MPALGFKPMTFLLALSRQDFVILTGIVITLINQFVSISSRTLRIYQMSTKLPLSQYIQSVRYCFTHSPGQSLIVGIVRIILFSCSVSFDSSQELSFEKCERVKKNQRQLEPKKTETDIEVKNERIRNQHFLHQRRFSSSSSPQINSRPENK